MAHINEDRLVLSRFVPDGTGFEAPSGLLRLLELPASPAAVGAAARRMLESPPDPVDPDDGLRARNYAQLAELLGLSGVDPLKLSPHLLVSVGPDVMRVGRIARPTPRSKLRISRFAALQPSASDTEIGSVFLAALDLT